MSSLGRGVEGSETGAAKNPPILGWTFEKAYEESVSFGRMTIETEGLVYKHPQYGYVSGASAGFDRSQLKARFELLERINLSRHVIENKGKRYTLRDPHLGKPIGEVAWDEVFPQSGDPNARIASSNGAALHDSWEKACRAGALELVERHLVLESFFGRRKPERLNTEDSLFADFGIDDIYEYQSHSLGFQMTDVYREPIYVVTALLIPKDTARHMQIIAYGAGFSEDEARVKAEREVMQRYGFLYDAEIPEAVAISATGHFHQNFHFIPGNHWQIRCWLDGDFDDGLTRMPSCLRLRFADLASPVTEGYAMAKAISAEAHDLVWGQTHQSFFGALGEETFLVHPIP